MASRNTAPPPPNPMTAALQAVANRDAASAEKAAAASLALRRVAVVETDVTSLVESFGISNAVARQYLAEEDGSLVEVTRRLLGLPKRG